jgi:hypothetical protein
MVSLIHRVYLSTATEYTRPSPPRSMNGEQETIEAFGPMVNLNGQPQRKLDGNG